VADLAIRLRGVVKRYGPVRVVGPVVFALITWRVAIFAMTRELID
jgi:hypothetical protein